MSLQIHESQGTLSQVDLSQTIDLILAENHHALTCLDEQSTLQLIETLTEAERIFVVGEGRSGLAVRMAAMRLMHLGCQVYVVGETTTPALRPDDLLLAVSGSGRTGTVALIARQAQEIGGRVVAVTTQPDSPLGRMADVVVTIDAATKHDHSRQRSQQFAGSLFEQAALLLFDAVFHMVSWRLRKRAETLSALHTNLE
jgi:6-phospho-3-hexuloisomerase